MSDPELTPNIDMEVMPTETLVEPQTAESPTSNIRLFAAVDAARHAQAIEADMKQLLSNHGIPDDKFIVMSGFNEEVLQYSSRHVQEIHIYSLVENSSQALFDDLANMISPFTGAFRTPTTFHHLPRSKHSPPSNMGYDTSKITTYMMETEQYSLAESIKLSQESSCIIAQSSVYESADSDGGSASLSSSIPTDQGSIESTIQGSSSGKGKGKEREQSDYNDQEEEVSNESQSTRVSFNDIEEQPAVHFDVSTAIYQPETSESSDKQLFQHLKTIGRIVPKAHASSTVIEFKKLRLQGHLADKPAYEQNFLRVIIDSKHPLTAIDVNHPHQTSASDNKLKNTTTREYNFGVDGLTQGFVPSPTAGFKYGHSTEQVKLLSRITQAEDRGVVWWGFEVDDRYAKERGAVFLGKDLPSVEFKFLGKPPFPLSASVEIGAYWSLPVKKLSWWKWLLSVLGRKNQGKILTPYFNLCQAVLLTFPTTLTQSGHYFARQEAYLSRTLLQKPAETQAENMAGKFGLRHPSSKEVKQQRITNASLFPLLSDTPGGAD